jgi:hypothetical protein
MGMAGYVRLTGHLGRAKREARAGQAAAAEDGERAAAAEDGERAAAAEDGERAAAADVPSGHPPMLLIDAEGDADGGMLLTDEGVLLMEGDEDDVGMFMCIGEPPRPMLWWIATHQFQTFSCGVPATTPMTWPSSWVQTMYSWGVTLS